MFITEELVQAQVAYRLERPTRAAALTSLRGSKASTGKHAYRGALHRWPLSRHEPRTAVAA